MINLCNEDLSRYQKIYFKVETNKDFTGYSIGEEMVFTATLFADGVQVTAPFFKYTFTGDDGQTGSGYLAPKAGEAVYRASLSCAGMVRLVLEIADCDRNVVTADHITKFEGGALASAAEITTTAEEPKDFDAFWAEQLDLLAQCQPQLLSCEQIKSPREDFDCYIVKIDCIGNPATVATNATWATGILTVPKHAEKHSLRLQMLFQGYGIVSTTVNCYPDAVTLQVCAHSIEQLQEASYYTGESLGLVRYGMSEQENQRPECSYFRHMILRDVQALRFLKKHFGAEGERCEWAALWNGHDIDLNGGSQGAFQATAVSALCPHDVTTLDLWVPWFCDVAGNTQAERVKSVFRPVYTEGLRYFDTAFMARRVCAPKVTVLAGAGDDVCPMHGVQALFNNLQVEEAVLTFRQGMWHTEKATVAIDSVQKK